METNRIHQFRVVVEIGNLRKAAELLGISHSGLSKSLKALENEMGFVLFQPSGRGIVPSDEAMKLYERSQRFLSECDLFLGKKLPLQQDVLRIGSFEVFTSYFMGPLLKNYLKDRNVEIHELVPGRLEEALFHNRVDVGITYEPVPRKGIEYVKATSILMGAYALSGKFSGMDLGKVPFVVPVSPLEGAASGVKGRDAWPDQAIERNVHYRVDLMATGLEIVRQGLGAIFIPCFIAELHNKQNSRAFELSPLKLPNAVAHVKREVFIVKRESTTEDQVIRLIARALRDIC